ncbi:hypothetical protein RUMCAL_02858 [Ruminococcus callidus ATCC 27760]|uniref:Uncharacterized protein n=1 Tax=Ruminococcus callidus ATCC 27760 TaxID=411473 RepID=U2JV32_9FIRM|nr:hypothetical protein RUMCAL_02858 [Ruminococcus callidus ATCC 27760]
MERCRIFSQHRQRTVRFNVVLLSRRFPSDAQPALTSHVTVRIICAAAFSAEFGTNFKCFYIIPHFRRKSKCFFKKIFVFLL